MNSIQVFSRHSVVFHLVLNIFLNVVNVNSKNWYSNKEVDELLSGLQDLENVEVNITATEYSDIDTKPVFEDHHETTQTTTLSYHYDDWNCTWFWPGFGYYKLRQNIYGESECATKNPRCGNLTDGDYYCFRTYYFDDCKMFEPNTTFNCGTMFSQEQEFFFNKTYDELKSYEPNLDYCVGRFCDFRRDPPSIVMGVGASSSYSTTATTLIIIVIVVAFIIKPELVTYRNSEVLYAF